MDLGIPRYGEKDFSKEINLIVTSSITYRKYPWNRKRYCKQIQFEVLRFSVSYETMKKNFQRSFELPWIIESSNFLVANSKQE